MLPMDRYCRSEGGGSIEIFSIPCPESSGGLLLFRLGGIKEAISSPSDE
jgi:hypothetical protein